MSQNICPSSYSPPPARLVDIYEDFDLWTQDPDAIIRAIAEAEPQEPIPLLFFEFLVDLVELLAGRGTCSNNVIHTSTVEIVCEVIPPIPKLFQKDHQEEGCPHFERDYDSCWEKEQKNA